MWIELLLGELIGLAVFGLKLALICSPVFILAWLDRKTIS